jgi:predicted ATPase/class 3 adenylate cyclase
MADLPTGTVTFLFTDIEGSTRLWQKSPAAMEAAHARHDALLREAVERNNGYVFKTVGDAFCAAFHTASAALAAALAAQRALTQEPWPEAAHIKVRMGLHTGAADVRANDYFGQPLNHVARLLAAGHGGQVLLTLATQELVRDSLPTGVTLRDMGERRLKDLIRPDRVYQMVAPGLPADFPPVNTLDVRAHNLPIQSTSFVGRDREMQEVKTLLRAARLVSLTGSGGAGKTRLSLQAGADCIDDFADGVWLVELASLTDGRLVPQSVATVLGIKEQPAIAINESLAKELKHKELLLLLDNCEHLIEASAQVCQSLLATCANIRILVTSREALRIPGESVYRVPSLATPDSKSNSSVEVLTQYAAVQLFIDRALAVKSSFHVNNFNAPAVASICRHLDGIPLAIELAAARVRSMSVDEVNRRLDQRFRLLTDGSRTALPRQQTLRSLIDWSYDLLNDGEKALLRGVSVFLGGWTLEGAQEVCVGAGVHEDAVLDLLTSLVDKNLVVAEERNGATRYRLLETVRQYAADRLLESGEAGQLRDRHLAYFLAVAEQAAPQLRGPDQQAWLDRLETEHDNFRSALTWSSAAAGDGAGGLRLAGALSWFWLVHGHFGEGRGWLFALLAGAPEGQVVASRIKALIGAGILAFAQSDFAAARVLLEESLATAREIGDQFSVGVALNNLGNVAINQGDYAAARPLYEESLALRRELGHRSGIAASLSNLANVARAQGDYATARALHEESMAILQELGDQRAKALSLTNLGNVVCDQGDYAAARMLYVESLALAHELNDRLVVAEALEGLAHVAAALAVPSRAARIWGAAERLREEIGAPLPPNERPRYDPQVASARAAMEDDPAFDSAWQEGRTMTLEQAVEYGLKRQDG